MCEVTAELIEYQRCGWCAFGGTALSNRFLTLISREQLNYLLANTIEISAELYKEAAAKAGPAPEAGPQPGGPPPKKDADVVDAEFEMVDEDKKK